MFSDALCRLAHKPMGRGCISTCTNAIRKLSHTNAPHVEFRRWKTEFPNLHLWNGIKEQWLGPLSHSHNPAGFKRPFKISSLPFYPLIYGWDHIGPGSSNTHVRLVQSIRTQIFIWMWINYLFLIIYEQTKHSYSFSPFFWNVLQ